MLAFVLAIGMSFAFTSEAPGDLVLEIDGVLYQSPIDCQGQGENCTARISIDGDVLEVQVLRETANGDYVDAKTGVPSTTVYPFSSLTEVTP
ncbi:DUF6520 family protein [Galbibacter orientalis]|uniref:DUF6520 family protein n=1 Tax=Galbibacter orientalis TaxID=453852 RepID=UPI003B516C77